MLTLIPAPYSRVKTAKQFYKTWESSHTIDDLDFRILSVQGFSAYGHIKEFCDTCDDNAVELHYPDYTLKLKYDPKTSTLELMD